MTRLNGASPFCWWQGAHRLKRIGVTFFVKVGGSLADARDEHAASHAKQQATETPLIMTTENTA